MRRDVDEKPPSRFRVFVNRRASRAESALRGLRRCLDAAGIEAEVVIPDDPDEIADRIRSPGGDLCADDVVILAGGDGTLHHALPALVEAGSILGIVPLGTANDLARSLGIPLDPEDALRVIARGRSRRIDLGRVNGRLFVNVASVGITGEVTRGLADGEKKRWGALSYPMRAVSVFRRTQPFRVELVADGRRAQFRALQVSVANGLSFGGGMQVDRDARLDDGQFEVCVIRARGPWRLALLVPLLWIGRVGWGESAEVQRARGLSLRTSRVLDVSADGEIVTQTPAEFEVVPQALEVFVSGDADDAFARPH